MPVPSYQEFMLPLLRSFADGKEHALVELRPAISAQLGLKPSDLEEKLPSGQRVYSNRVAWAAIYLARAILIERTTRGIYRITPRGSQVLAGNPVQVDVQFLNQFPEFVAFHRPKAHAGPAPVAEPTRTPEEVIEESIRELRDALAAELLAVIKKCSPTFFEKLVLDLLVAMGYGGNREDAAQGVRRGSDGGIDGRIKEDKLGLDVVYVQAKRWQEIVGRPVVQAFAGSLEGHRARKGVFLTTSGFTREARDYVEAIEKRIVLVDGQMLTELMIEHGVGVATTATYRLHRIDQDFFEES